MQPCAGSNAAGRTAPLTCRPRALHPVPGLLLACSILFSHPDEQHPPPPLPPLQSKRIALERGQQPTVAGAALGADSDSDSSGGGGGTWDSGGGGGAPSGEDDDVPAAAAQPEVAHLGMQRVNVKAGGGATDGKRRGGSAPGGAPHVDEMSLAEQEALALRLLQSRR